MHKHPWRGLGLLARRLVVVTVAAVGLSLAVAPAAQAWYPEGFTIIRDCGDPIPPPNTPLTAIGEPLLGHTGPWSPRVVSYNSPSHKVTKSTQRRAVAFRVVSHRCEGPHLYMRLRYSQFEVRHSYINYVKGGGSTRPLPDQPVVTDWKPYP